MSFTITNPPNYIDINRIYNLNFNLDTYNPINNNVMFFNQKELDTVAITTIETISTDESIVSYIFNKSIKNVIDAPFKKISKVESIIRDVKISTSNFKNPLSFLYEYPETGTNPSNTGQFITLDNSGVQLDPTLVTIIRISRIVSSNLTPTPPQYTVFEYDKYLSIGARTSNLGGPQPDTFANFTYEIVTANNTSPDYYEFNVRFIPSQSADLPGLDFVRVNLKTYFIKTRNRLQGRSPENFGLIFPINFSLHGHNFSINTSSESKIDIVRDGRERYWVDIEDLNYFMDLNRDIYNYYDSKEGEIIELNTFPESSQLTMSFIRNFDNIRGYHVYDTYSNIPNNLSVTPNDFEYSYFGMYQISISYTLRIYPVYEAQSIHPLREPEELTMYNIKKMILERDKKINEKETEEKEKNKETKKKKKKLIIESITGKVNPELYQEILNNILDL